MGTFQSDSQVIPRPIGELPPYANAKARTNLASRLSEAFDLSEAAVAIANAVVDPTTVRKSIGDPKDPDVERILVPGGTLLGVRANVWARRIMPDPRNPRTLPARRHPYAVEPGGGSEDSKFRPLPEPRANCSDEPNKAELAIDVESRHHLTWAAQQAAAFVLAENDWRVSIASQGVMEAVWLVATTYEHEDGSAPATALTTVEGSSRITAVHDLLQIRSSDVPYDENEIKLRTHIRRLNRAYERGPNKDETVGLRCQCVPALILLAFAPHDGGPRFPTAVKSLVALRHVDPPKPWGEGPEFESLADEVLAELYRRDLISSAEHAYYAGSCTRAEAKAAHLPDDLVSRSTRIVRMFTSQDERVGLAIRVAVTSQSTRKRITSKLLHDLATVLILRSIADDPSRVDQIRRYLRHSFARFVHTPDWKLTSRSDAQLTNDALDEVRTWIGDPSVGDPGPSTMELAVRATYPLVVTGRLNADRGSAGNEQPDRRTPGQILDVMRSSPQGVHQLGRAVQDFREDRTIRAVDEEGRVKQLADDQGDQYVSDIYLRNEFPPPGKTKKASDPGDTPRDQYVAAQSAFEAAVAKLTDDFELMYDIRGNDGMPLADSLGTEPRLVDRWRNQLKRIDEELVVWASIYRRKHGAKRTQNGDATAPEEQDPYDE
ncbi:MAG: hypothetical protein F4Y86_06785 [Gammaproteobacteria bacterium]|nr:hypothetical protein [Gammaproteobacteria bacterium]